MWEIIPCSRNSQMNEWIKISKLTRRFAKNFLLPQVLSNALTVRDSQAWKHDHNDQLKNHIVNCQDVNHPKLRIATQKLVPNSKNMWFMIFVCVQPFTIEFWILGSFRTAFQIYPFVWLPTTESMSRNTQKLCPQLRRIFTQANTTGILPIFKLMLIYWVYE